jgi:putative membrane protein
MKGKAGNLLATQGTMIDMKIHLLLPTVLRCAALLAAVSATPVCLRAQTGASSSAESGLASKDRSFLLKAAKGGEKEIVVSQAVLPHLLNPQVRDFAQMMITDHTSANLELSKLAAGKEVELPALDATVGDKWAKKDNGADKDYIGEMVDDHEAVVKLFKKAAQSSDADIAAFAEKMLPTLQHHLDVAQALKKSL